MAEIMSNKIRTTLNHLIHTDQTGFVPGRNISENVCKVVDEVNLISNHNIAASLLLVDFEKAFDRVEYSSLIGALKYFNFGSYIQSWITILFTDFALCTVNNGHSSEYFKPTRGLFQGNPISSTGFIILIELLAIAIRSNPKIRPVTVKNIQLLLYLFADDMSIFLPSDIRSWEELKRVISNFENISGSKVNYEKTMLYRIGSARCRDALYYAMHKLHWSEGEINILGIQLNKDKQQITWSNVEPLIDKAKVICDIWKMRGLSLLGGITVFNTLHYLSIV